MKFLLLLRHAIALPATSASGDLGRALSPAGQGQARAVGDYLLGRSWVPQRVLCSPAVRTRETAERVLDALGAQPALLMIDTLYNANVDDMLSVLREQAADADRLLLVGHAPAVGELASALCTRGDDLALYCEPATLLEVALNITSWPDIAHHCGSLRLLMPA
jgi:phosphohistidine phosphatase